MFCSYDGMARCWFIFCIFLRACRPFACVHCYFPLILENIQLLPLQVTISQFFLFIKLQLNTQDILSVASLTLDFYFVWFLLPCVPRYCLLGCFWILFISVYWNPLKLLHFSILELVFVSNLLYNFCSSLFAAKFLVLFYFHLGIVSLFILEASASLLEYL